jgi:peptidoglycan biosynthesis protein MviN/MurJ (putative lipid II flippase)
VALEFYMYGLPAMAVNRVIGRVFHALQRMRARMWLAVQYLATNTLGNWLLVDDLQVQGLAISSSVAITLHVALSLVILHRFRAGLAVPRITATVTRVYLLGGATLAAYHLLGVGGLLAGLGSGQVAALGAGAAKAVFVFAVFGILYGLNHVLERRRAAGP